MTNVNPRYRLCLTSDKGKTFWNLLSQSEREQLNDLLGKTDGLELSIQVKPKQYIGIILLLCTNNYIKFKLIILI